MKDNRIVIIGEPSGLPLSRRTKSQKASIHAVVMPGEALATTEELEPGKGTFEENGNIYSSVFGTFFIEKENTVAVVMPANPLVTLEKGDVVIGKVASVRSSMVMLEVACLEGNDRAISGNTAGVVHVSKASEHFISDVSKEFGKGEIVRAEVLSGSPSLQLTTASKHLGVLKAMCARCRHELVKKGEGLECPECGNIETRKMSDDYGQFEPEIK